MGGGVNWRRVRRGVLAGAIGVVLALVAVAWWGRLHPVHGDLDAVRSDRAGIRILFVGNSFTATNPLWSMLAQLARGERGGPSVFAVGFTRDGATLSQAAGDDKLLDLIHRYRWDYVVLQEQSAVPALPHYREQHMYPAARSLDSEVRRVGARTLLFLTWGYRDGDDRDYPGDTYAAMQGRLEEGYARLARGIHARVVPVGLAWEAAMQRVRDLDLWQGDGRHPDAKGTYIAAAAFYAAITGRDPSQSSYTAGLEPAEAHRLASTAAEWSRAYGRQYLTDSR